MDTQKEETGIDRKRVDPEVVTYWGDKGLRWGGGMPRQRRETEVVGLQEREAGI